MTKIKLVGAVALLGTVAAWQFVGQVDTTSGELAAGETETTSNAGATAHLTIAGMTCSSCAVTARVALKRMPGIRDAAVSLESGTGTVVYDPVETKPEAFIAELARMTGYVATVEHIETS